MTIKLRKQKAPPVIISVGDKFEHWTVISFAEMKPVGVKGKKISTYLVECDCKNKTRKTLNRTVLISGDSKSCGCLKTLRLGDSYNKWTVIEKTNEKNYKGQFLYIVECSCVDKNRKKYSYSQIITGKPKSCGCIKKGLIKYPDGLSEEHKKNISLGQFKSVENGSHGRANKNFTKLTKKYPQKATAAYGENLANAVINGVKSSAKQRNLEFSIDLLEGFEKYCLGDCFYCGFKPNWPETHNGIDRVDNEKGYIEGNCVSCCKFCNSAKLNYSLDYLKFRINKLFNYFILNNKEVWFEANFKLKERNFIGQKSIQKPKTALAIKYPDNYGIIKSSYAQRIWSIVNNYCIDKCKKRNFKYDIDPIYMFEKFIIGICNYCGLKPQFPDTRNGIDRVDSNKGYTEENCVSCCTFCNYAKLDNTIEEFKEWIIRIYIHLNTAGWNFKE